MAKEKLLPKSNVIFTGMKNDVNGNRCICLCFDGQKRGFSIQMNNSILNILYPIFLGVKSVNDCKYFTENDWNFVSKQVCEYVSLYGSKKQKELINIG